MDEVEDDDEDDDDNKHCPTISKETLPTEDDIRAGHDVEMVGSIPEEGTTKPDIRMKMMTMMMMMITRTKIIITKCPTLTSALTRTDGR